MPVPGEGEGVRWVAAVAASLHASVVGAGVPDETRAAVDPGMALPSEQSTDSLLRIFHQELAGRT